ncbi:hypothetical protein LUZ60_014588 [Juncus effusus]|nr:hypothetical protein LUZ60_014588 [Juncus effusus]
MSSAPSAAAAAGLGDSSPQRKSSKKPKYSQFSQQELPACKPLLTPGIVIATFFVIAVIFIPIGLASLAASQSVVEVVHRYDADCVPKDMRGAELAYIQNSKIDKTCTVKLTIPKLMQSPIHVYYELDEFYQNHRRYVKSRNDKQLLNPKFEKDTQKLCGPEDYFAGKPIVPCGLIAWSLFNDTYQFSVGNRAIEVNKKNIAWASDKSHKFGKDVYPKNFQKGPLVGGASLNESIPLSEQEALIVWMRTAALPQFRKIFGRIERDLQRNDQITVTIQNNYNAYSFGGKKKLVLSTASWIGGKNNFLGLAYLSVGGLCLALALFFIALYVFKPRTLGDPMYLSWNRVPAGGTE